MIVRPLLDWMSPSGRGGRLSVFIFHRVLPEPDPLFPDEIHAKRFGTICDWIKQWFNVLPLDEGVARLGAGTLPARAAAITFDDGYADNFNVALPILLRHGLSATFFVATGFLDGGCMWNDMVIESVRRTKLHFLPIDKLFGAGHAGMPVRNTGERFNALNQLIDRLKYKPVAERSALVAELASLAAVVPPADLMMTSEEVRLMRRAGMLIGAHTVSHPILANMDRADARDEIWQSKRMLENLLGESVGLFAYPNGKPGVDFTAETVGIVRELGFDAAVTTSWAVSRDTTDKFQIPRFTPWDRNRLRFGMRMISKMRSERAQ